MYRGAECADWSATVSDGFAVEHVNLPSDDCIALAHVAQVIHQLPHRRVVDFDLVDIYGQQCETSAAQ